MKSGEEEMVPHAQLAKEASEGASLKSPEQGGSKIPFQTHCPTTGLSMHSKAIHKHGKQSKDSRKRKKTGDGSSPPQRHQISQ